MGIGRYTHHIAACHILRKQFTHFDPAPAFEDNITLGDTVQAVAPRFDTRLDTGASDGNFGIGGGVGQFEYVAAFFKEVLVPVVKAVDKVGQASDFIFGRQLFCQLNEFIEFVIHMQLGEFMKAADPLAVDGNLWHGARAIGEQAEITARAQVGVDASLFIWNAPFGQQRFCAVAHRADAGAEYFYSGHGYSRLKPDIKDCFYCNYIV